MGLAIKVENLSKAYQLGQFSTGTLSRDIERAWAQLRGKEDPFLKIGETNDRTSKGESNIIWSLKDINFEVEQGQAVGIIGRNGAGKSTLLKVLSRVTSPTRGNVKIKGRVASLLEVGTGFHPELTGRENIFLNGAILGMRKYEIKRKFDEIVDFAGVERYVDTPVKRYSSGMYVRLAFAVAAYLESEILIVDEVLAVGDAEFQKKCIGKMGEVSKGEGRTVLFVSHNMNAVRSLCDDAILINNGRLSFQGTSRDVVDEYIKIPIESNSNGVFRKERRGIQPIEILEVRMLSKSGASSNTFDFDDVIGVQVEYAVNCRVISSSLTMHISDQNQIIYGSYDTDFDLKELSERHSGVFRKTIEMPLHSFKEGKYYLTIGAGMPNSETYEEHHNCISFEVIMRNRDDSFLSYAKKREGVIPLMVKWKQSELSLK